MTVRAGDRVRLPDGGVGYVTQVRRVGRSNRCTLVVVVADGFVLTPAGAVRRVA